MEQGKATITLWLGLVAAAIALVLPAAVQASANVVPTPSLLLGGRGRPSLRSLRLLS
jgi:hypothetical protein